MAYKIEYTDPNNKNNPNVITVNDMNINRDTDLVFVGKNYPDYAKFIGENFLHLLENFSSTVAPTSPVIGQLWYDTDSRSPQLKIFDGSSWVEASGIKKSNLAPTSAESGNLWVDPTNQQLYLYSGTRWVLVGPQFSGTSTSGVTVADIIDSATNTMKTVLQFSIDNNVVAMFSIHDFVPKNKIEGFSRIRQGLTLSSKDFSLAGVLGTKFWGTSEKSSALLVENTTVPSTKFLRSDVVSTTEHALNIRSNAGLSIGQSLETTLSSNSTAAVLKTKNASISLQTDAGEILTLNSQGVGIGTTPTRALDVNGAAKIGGLLELGASLTVAGDISVNVGSVVLDTIRISNSESTFTDILPYDSNNNIGRISAPFKQVYASEFIGETFTGSFNGNLDGLSSRASRLNVPTKFSLSGDVVLKNGPISFDGSADITFDTTISNDIIVNRENEALAAFDDDYFLVHQQNQLRKMKKATLFSAAGTIPVGTILPYAGDTPPPGTLFCDGSEQDCSVFSELFNVVKYKFTPPSGLRGVNTFALPDLRGRSPLGVEIMNNASTMRYQVTASGVTRSDVLANDITVRYTIPNNKIVNGPFQVGRILTGIDQNGNEKPLTDIDVSGSPAIIQSITVDGQNTILVVSVASQLSRIPSKSGLAIASIGSMPANSGNPTPPRVSAATKVGVVGGSSTQTLSVSNLPEHEHDLKGSAGTQFYAINDKNTVPTDQTAFRAEGPTGANDGQYLPSSGGILTSSPLGQPVSVMNPYLVTNYIIFTGHI